MFTIFSTTHRQHIPKCSRGAGYLPASVRAEGEGRDRAHGQRNVCFVPLGIGAQRSPWLGGGTGHPRP
jgi:hypothetical protein